MSKGRVNVHVRPDASTLACTTDPDGLAVLVNRLKSPQLQLIAMEASCGYTESCSINRRKPYIFGCCGNPIIRRCIDTKQRTA